MHYHSESVLSRGPQLCTLPADGKTAQNIDDNHAVHDDNQMWIHKGMQRQIHQVSAQSVLRDGILDPYYSVYHGLPANHDVLKCVPNCRYFTTKRFQYESS